MIGKHGSADSSLPKLTLQSNGRRNGTANKLTAVRGSSESAAGFSEQNKSSRRPCSAVPRAESSFSPESMVPSTITSLIRLNQGSLDLVLAQEVVGDHHRVDPSTTGGPRALRRGRMMAMAGGVKGDL